MRAGKARVSFPKICASAFSVLQQAAKGDKPVSEVCRRHNSAEAPTRSNHPWRGNTFCRCATGKKDTGIFIGLWAPTFLSLGTFYNTENRVVEDESAP